MTGLWTRWRASSAPSLVIRGEQAPYLSAELMARMATARSDVDRVTIPRGTRRACGPSRGLQHPVALGFGDLRPQG